METRIVTISTTTEREREVPCPFYYEAHYDSDYSYSETQGRVSDDKCIAINKRTSLSREITWELEVTNRGFKDRGDTSYMRGDHDSTKEKFYKLFNELCSTIQDLTEELK